jgi:hypothetical protein
MRRSLQFLFISVVAAAIAACASPSATQSPAASLPATAGPTVHLPTADPSTADPSVNAFRLLTEDQPSDACMEALAFGTLVPDPQSTLAIAAPDGMRTRVMWPFGYSAQLVENVLELYDADGAYVAREGDQIEMSGGFGAGDLFYACGGTVRIAN